MQKSINSKVKDSLRTIGKVWVKDTTLNYRQSSGVEFRGRWVEKRKSGENVGT